MLDIVTLNGYKIKDEKAVRSYETVALMKADTKLKEGYHVKTKGYYEANDGGNSEYYITSSQSETEYQEELESGLYATLIIGDEINIKQIGAYGDNNHDDTLTIQYAIDNYDTIFIPEGEYKITNFLEVGFAKNIRGMNQYRTIINCHDTDAIHFKQSAQRGTIQRLRFLGDNSQHKTFVFNEGVAVWKFDEIWIRNFGDTYFYSNNNGHIHDISIQNSQFDNGLNNCIEFIFNANAQVNGVSITNCNFNKFTHEAIAITGNSVKIDSNIIQTCEYGIVISPEKRNGTSTYGSVHGIMISSNYFEATEKNNILIVPCYNDNTSGNELLGYISGICIINNFGSLSSSNTDYYHVHIEFTNNGTTSTNFYSNKLINGGSVITGLVYMGNYFTINSTNNHLINGGYMLENDSFIIVDGVTGQNTSQNNIKPDLINMNNAYILNKNQVLTGVHKSFNGQFVNLNAISYINNKISLLPDGYAYYCIDNKINTINNISVTVTSDDLVNNSTFEIYGYLKTTGEKILMISRTFKAASSDDRATTFDFPMVASGYYQNDFASFDIVIHSNSSANVTISDIITHYIRQN